MTDTKRMETVVFIYLLFIYYSCFSPLLQVQGSRAGCKQLWPLLHRTDHSSRESTTSKGVWTEYFVLKKKIQKNVQVNFKLSHRVFCFFLSLSRAGSDHRRRRGRVGSRRFCPSHGRHRQRIRHQVSDFELEMK